VSKIAVETAQFGTLPTYVYPGGYDSTKLGLGPLMIQTNDSGNEGKWVGPFDIKIGRPIEVGGLVPAFLPSSPVNWSSDVIWVFFGDNATAAATRRISLWTFTKSTRTWSNAGFITLTLPSQGTQGTYTCRGVEVSYEKYTQGTVAINNGSASLTGTGTSWSANRMFVGSRIGFPTVAGDPTTVPQWYEISAIGSDTAITLTSNFAQSNISGANYIIEDLRILSVYTNGTTAANGGLFMAAGIRFENFSGAGTTISAATTTDKIRAVYWLGDGNASSNVTIQSPGGVVVDSRVSWTNQLAYVGDFAAGQSRFAVSNFRAAMTLTAGRDSTSSTWQLNTGQQAVTGTVSQIGNLVLCTPSHGPRSGSKSLFWVTTTRIYSALVSNITSASTSFQSGSMVEVPPGSTTTFTATAALSTINYSSSIDRFQVFTSGATAFRHYLTQYREDGGQMDRIFLSDSKQINQSTVDATVSILPSTLSLACSASSVDGMLIFVTHGTTALTNLIYNIPIGADWEFSTVNNNRVVFPAMSLVNPSKFSRAYMNVVEVLGGKTGTNLGQEPGAVRLYYRTSGISDNSGSWTLLDYAGDMSGVSASGLTQIQFMCEFRVVTLTGLPGRVLGVGCSYNDTGTDSHYRFSADLSDKTGKRFAWKFGTAFGGSVPRLRVVLFNDVTGATLIDDDTTNAAAGVFERSTDGGSNWSAWNNTDKGNETTFIRYTPTSIADNIQVRARLLQY